jgi:hypothetical protein
VDNQEILDLIEKVKNLDSWRNVIWPIGIY